MVTPPLITPIFGVKTCQIWGESKPLYCPSIFSRRFGGKNGGVWGGGQKYRTDRL